MRARSCPRSARRRLRRPRPGRFGPASRSAPRRPPVSSSGTMTRPTRARPRRRRAAYTIEASPLFMSEAPRPIRRRRRAAAGTAWERNAGTTSVTVQSSVRGRRPPRGSHGAVLPRRRSRRARGRSPRRRARHRSARRTGRTRCRASSMAIRSRAKADDLTLGQIDEHGTASYPVSCALGWARRAAARPAASGRREATARP